MKLNFRLRNYAVFFIIFIIYLIGENKLSPLSKAIAKSFNLLNPKRKIDVLITNSIDCEPIEIEMIFRHGLK